MPATAQRECKVGSALALTKQAGELVATTYKLQKTGYKAPNAYGSKPVFSSETTQKHFIKKVRAAADSTCMSKKLVPYSPNAPRNRPKETLINIPGRRYGVHPTTTTERYKGASSVAFVSSDPESRRRWKTTNEVFAACAQVTGMTGMANAGISSDIAKRLHKTQGIYH